MCVYHSIRVCICMCDCVCMCVGFLCVSQLSQYLYLGSDYFIQFKFTKKSAG